MEPFVGEIRMFAGRYAPEGWATCDGQALQVQEYQLLFALLGTAYGGDGVNTFNLPDFRGRVLVGAGAGPGLTPRVAGQTGGSETVTLTEAQLPSHSHSFNATNSPATTNALAPAGQYLATLAAGTGLYQSPTVTGAVWSAMAQDTLGTAGSGIAHPNMMLTTTITFIIALQGDYPAES